MKIVVLSGVVAGLVLLLPLQGMSQQEGIPAGQRQAIISMVKGEVFLKKAGQEKALPSYKGALLGPGDRIITKKNGNVELVLDDSSVLKLKDNSTLEIQALDEQIETKKKNSIFKLFLGKLLSKVDPARAGSFKVITLSMIAGVRGTTFGINARPDNSSDIYVLEGEVEATGFSAGQIWNVVVPSGKAFSALGTGEQGRMRDMTPQELKEWQDISEEKEEAKEEKAKEKEEKKEEREEKKEEKKEEKPSASMTGKGLVWGGSIGAVNLDGVMYYRVALQPVFKIGKLKAALNLSVTWNDTSGIKPYTANDWLCPIFPVKTWDNTSFNFSSSYSKV